MTHVTMILNPSCCALTGTPDLHWSLVCLVNTLNNTWWGTSYPEQLGLTKFPAHALDITWFHRWEKYYIVYALICLKSARFFLSASPSSHAVYFLFTPKFIYLPWPIGYLDLYVSKAQTRHIQNGTQLSLQEWPPPAFPAPAADTTSLEFLGFFLILDPTIKNHQPILFSLPLDWFRTPLRLSISATTSLI